MLPRLDGTLVHRRYFPNNVGTRFQRSKVKQIGEKEIAWASKSNRAWCEYQIHDPRVLSPTP